MRAHFKGGYLLLAVSLLAGVSSPAAAATRRARAIAAYERATEMRAALESKPEKERQRAEYQKLINVFQSVYRASPRYTNTPLALAAVAEVYEQMGRRFADARYFREAIKAYEFLQREYPQHRLSRDALFAIGEVYRTDLNDREAARQAFQQLLDQKPKSRKVAEAKEKLALLQEVQVARNQAPSLPVVAEAQRSNGLARVTDVRRWVGGNYSRIVIALDSEAKFEALRLANPDRLVFNLLSTRLSPELVGKAYPVEDGFLRQVRLGQYSATVTRIVLDVAEIEDYSVFSLPNPFRLVIDIHGTAKPEVAAKTKVPEPAKAAKPIPETARVVTATPGPSPARTEAESQPIVTSQPTLAASQKKADPASTGNREEVATKTQAAATPEQQKQTAVVRTPPAPPRRTTTEVAKAALSAEPEPPSIRAAAPTASGARTLTRALGLKIARVVIDAGHGGHDTGCLGPSGYREKDVVLDVGMRLKKLIERNMGSEVIMTRDNDTFIQLEERTAIANEHAADLFISIHANASRNRRARGVETYYLNFTSDPEALEVAARENATSQESVHKLQDLIRKIALAEKIEESHELAKHVQYEISRRLQQPGDEQRDRGVRKAPFVVLIGANMPSVLAEISFLTNPRDERLLKKGDYRQKVAAALYAGISRYVENLGGVVVAQKTATDASGTGPVADRSPAADSPNF